MIQTIKEMVEAEERIKELEQQVAEWREALATIAGAMDAYGVGYCRGKASEALDKTREVEE